MEREAVTIFDLLFLAVGTHGVHSHGFLDDTCQVGQLVQVSVVRAPGEGLVRHSQQPMLPQLSYNLLLHLTTHAACVEKQDCGLHPGSEAQGCMQIWWAYVQNNA